MENERNIQLLKAKHAAEMLQLQQQIGGGNEEDELEKKVLMKESAGLQHKLKKAEREIETYRMEINMLKDKINDLKSRNMNDPCQSCGWNSLTGSPAPDPAKIRSKMKEMDSQLDDLLQVPPKPSLTEQNFLIGAKKDPDQEALEAAILVSMQVEQFGKR
jgi:chromosome segregation ATPase